MARSNGGIIGPYQDYTNVGISGVWSMSDQQQFKGSNKWDIALTGVGLLGQFYQGITYRPTIADGNIGSLPLSSPTVYTSIIYSNISDLYGFIAIGYFIPPTTGTYTFYTSSDDGSGVWVGSIASATSGRTSANAVVNNNLGGGQGDTKRSGTINLTQNIPYAIRIVHEEGGGGDNLTFSWSGPSIAETTALGTYFRFPRNRAGNTIANYI